MDGVTLTFDEGSDYLRRLGRQFDRGQITLKTWCDRVDLVLDAVERGHLERALARYGD